MRITRLNVAIASLFLLTTMGLAAQQPDSPPIRIQDLLPYYSNSPFPSSFTRGELDDLDATADTGLSKNEIRKLQAAAGIADGDLPNRYVLVDAKTLKHSEIFIDVYSKDSRCLTAEVFLHHWGAFHFLWSLSEEPGGGRLCRLPNCPVPTATTPTSGEIVVTVPAHRDGARYNVCDDNRFLIYRPAGRSFQFASEQRLPSVEDCSQFYYSVFFQTDESKRLAWIEVEPIGGRDSVILFQSASDGPVIDYFGMPGPAWSPGDEPRNRNLITPSECIDKAMSAPLERTRIPLTGAQVQAILDSITKIDVRTDDCDRDRSGKCALFIDSDDFVVGLPNRTWFMMTNLHKSTQIRSANPALTAWLDSLMRLVDEYAPTEPVQRKEPADPVHPR